MSTLLALPSEIRNLIYQFALTPTRGRLEHIEVTTTSGPVAFLHEPGHGRTWSLPHPESEFNQLKYVNRQLYSETAGLELKHSRDLIFRDTTSPSRPCGAQAVKFLDSLPPGKRSWLSIIEIRATVNEGGFIRDNPTTLTRLDQLSTQHPNLRIAYEPPGLTFAPTEKRCLHALFLCLMYDVAIRQADTRQPLLRAVIAQLVAATDLDTEGSGSRLLRRVDEWRDGYELSLTSLTFRIFPVVRDERGKRSKDVPALLDALARMDGRFAGATYRKILAWEQAGL